jgi:hypothetical protein
MRSPHIRLRPFHAALPLALALAALGTGAAVSAAATAASPAVVKATLVTRQRGTPAPGITIPARDLFGQRVFLGASFGVALADTGQSQSPALTTDGGRTWKLVGPALHLDAAQAPLAVTTIGLANRRTFFAYGDSQALDVTSDAGRHWYRALFQGSVVAVAAVAPHQLSAFSLAGGGQNAATQRYVSTDGGRTWRLSG